MRMIIFIDLTGFYVTAFRRQAPSFLGQALAVVKDGIVLDASVEAAEWNVFRGIPRALALRRCPGLTCLEHDPDVYEPLFVQLWAVFAEMTPLVEPVDFHAGFLDLTGCIPRSTQIEKAINTALWRVQFETGLKGEWGGGRDKWIARLACGANHWIAPEDESAFLEHVPLVRLPADEDLCERMARYGILRVQDLLRTPQSFLQSHLQLSRKDLLPLLYRDASPVRALFPPPVLKTAAHLQWDDDEELLRTLHGIAEDAARILRECRRQSGRLRILLRARRGELLREVKLTRPVREARILELILQRILLEEHIPDLRYIELELASLSPAPQLQGALWQDIFRQDARGERIEAARHALEKKFGFQTVQNGRDYARRIPPRFAQMIYARRGITLP